MKSGLYIIVRFPKYQVKSMVTPYDYKYYEQKKSNVTKVALTKKRGEK